MSPAPEPAADGARPAALPSPFGVGFAAGVGVIGAWILLRSLVHARDMLVLLALSLFLAAGMDPVVRFGQRLGLRRGLSVAVTFLVVAGVVTGFGFAVAPLLADQASALAHAVPQYLDDLQRNGGVARLDRHVHVLDRLREYVSAGGLLRHEQRHLLGAGTTLATVVFEAFSVLVLTLYFMAYLDRIEDFAYRMVPRSRRERAQQVGSRITDQIGEYVAGNLLLGLLAGLVSLAWFGAIGAQYALALAFVVALLDVVPLLGAPLAIAVASAVVLADSVAGGIATLVFLSGYQVVENYVLVPRLFRHRVVINPVVTIIGALVGFGLLGVVGFLLALPSVAVLDLVLREVVVPRQARR